MNLALPTARIAQVWTPAPLGATKDVGFQMKVNGLHHVEDPRGENRRYFEGWASMPGLDMQDMEIAADACRKGAEKYLARNPVIVWHHQANMPIGRVESLSFDERGMYMTGVIFDMSEVLEQWADHRDEIPLDSIALKCQEVWKGIRSGAFRGLSIRGGVREVVPAWSDQLSKTVPRVLEVELYEISVTPIAIHPGTKITSINTVAKAFGEALEITKALDLQPQNDTTKGETMDVSKAWEAFQKSLAANADENGNVELPDAVSKGLEALGMEQFQVDPIKTPEQQIAELMEVNKSLLERVEAMEQGGNAAPAARRGFASVETPEGAKVRPTGAPTKQVNVIKKGLDMAASAFKGKTNFGEGDRFLLPVSDVYKMALIDAAQQGYMSMIDGVNLSPKAKEWAAEQVG